MEHPQEDEVGSINRRDTAAVRARYAVVAYPHSPPGARPRSMTSACRSLACGEELPVTRGCVATADLRKRGAQLSTMFQSEDPTVTVFGLVAAGVHGVTIALADGTSLTPEIVDDAFVLTTKSDPLRATWTNPDGGAGKQEPLVVRTSG